MKKLNKYYKKVYVIAAIFIAFLFYYITYKTPLAGDDWGYALNGMSDNPFSLALAFYNSWSGRIFSELWGFIIAPNKWLWNIINPILFVTIFLCLYKLGHVKKNYITSCLLIIAIILSVDDNLRMETYTWLMGTTYIIPLALSLVYMVIIEHLIYKTINIKNNDKILALSTNLLLFYIGLTMENIAVAMIVALIILLIYAYFNKRELFIYLIFNFISILISFMIMRLSPGANLRLLRDSYEWANLSMIEKLINGYPSFIEFTFIRNNYLILFMSLIISILLLETKNKIYIWFKYISIIIMLFGIISAFSFVLHNSFSFMQDSKSIYSSIFWLIYLIDILLILFISLNGKAKEKAIFLFMVGGSANLAMIYSPIFGSRSSIYTVIYMIAVMVIIINSLDIRKYELLGLFILSTYVCIDRFKEYHFKYKLVGLKQNERLEIIKYYKDHPEVKEAWIPRFPIYTVHGADIEIGDTYHFETFKEFYGLPQDADKIIFMIEED